MTVNKTHYDICKSCHFFYDNYHADYRSTRWCCGILPRTEENMRLTQKFKMMDELEFKVPSKCGFHVEHLLIDGDLDDEI